MLVITSHLFPTATNADRLRQSITIAPCSTLPRHCDRHFEILTSCKFTVANTLPPRVSLPRIHPRIDRHSRELPANPLRQAGIRFRTLASQLRVRTRLRRGVKHS
jgi:hypothetical protein